MLIVTREPLPFRARFFGKWLAETIHLRRSPLPSLLDMKSIHSRSLPSLNQSAARVMPWRRQMCPLYVSGLIGPGDRNSIAPMAKRLALGDEASRDAVMRQAAFEHVSCSSESTPFLQSFLVVKVRDQLSDMLY